MDNILNSLEIAITLSVHTHARIHWQLEVLMFEQATRTTESGSGRSSFFIFLSCLVQFFGAELYHGR
jgi:hypothetical protein